VSNWHVPDEISSSNHRHIQFQVGDLEVTRVPYCAPKRTNWEVYKEDPKANQGVISRVDMLGAECTAGCWHGATGHPFIYHQNCPARVALLPRMVIWWNKQLIHLKTSTNDLLIMLKRTGNCELYTTAHNCYNKEIRKAKWPLRGTTDRRLRMYLTGPDSRGSWPVSWPTGWGLLN